MNGLNRTGQQARGGGQVVTGRKEKGVERNGSREGYVSVAPSILRNSPLVKVGDALLTVAHSLPKKSSASTLLTFHTYRDVRESSQEDCEQAQVQTLLVFPICWIARLPPPSRHPFHVVTVGRSTTLALRWVQEEVLILFLDRETHGYPLAPQYRRLRGKRQRL